MAGEGGLTRSTAVVERAGGAGFVRHAAKVRRYGDLVVARLEGGIAEPLNDVELRIVLCEGGSGQHQQQERGHVRLHGDTLLAAGFDAIPAAPLAGKPRAGAARVPTSYLCRRHGGLVTGTRGP